MNKLDLYKLIKQYYLKGICKATTIHFSNKLNKSTAQITRYIKELKETGYIKIETTKLKKDITTKQFFKQRIIIPLKEI